MGAQLAICRLCGSSVLLTERDGLTATTALDAQLEPAPLPGLVAFNALSGKAKTLEPSDLDAAVRWVELGVTLHRLHREICDRRRPRRRRR